MDHFTVEMDHFTVENGPFYIAGEGGGFRTAVGQGPKGVHSPKCASPNPELERLGDWVADWIWTAPQSFGVCR